MSDKIIFGEVPLGEGEGEVDESGGIKFETEFEGIDDEELWLTMAKVINATCKERGCDYRYLGHYVTKVITREPSMSGSMANNKFFFEWRLNVVMEREAYESRSTGSTGSSGSMDTEGP